MLFSSVRLSFMYFYHNTKQRQGTDMFSLYTIAVSFNNKILSRLLQMPVSILHKLVHRQFLLFEFHNILRCPFFEFSLPCRHKAMTPVKCKCPIIFLKCPQMICTKLFHRKCYQFMTDFSALKPWIHLQLTDFCSVHLDKATDQSVIIYREIFEDLVFFQVIIYKGNNLQLTE